MALSELQERIVTALAQSDEARIIRHSNFHALDARIAGRCMVIQPEKDSWPVPGYTVKKLIGHGLIEVSARTHRYSVIQITPAGRHAASLVSKRKTKK